MHSRHMLERIGHHRGSGLLVPIPAPVGKRVHTAHRHFPGIGRGGDPTKRANALRAMRLAPRIRYRRI
jgi:hypothetical protein